MNKFQAEYELTDNEMKAYTALVKSCLWGMGGKRPSDFEDDQYTWIAAEDLIDAGWSRHEAAGTLGALEAKGLVYLDGRDSTLNDQWREFDKVWDEVQ